MSDLSKTKPVDFGKDMKELERIVALLEGGEVDLDKALPEFKQGIELAARLKQHLESVQNQVTIIKERFDQLDGKTE